MVRAVSVTSRKTLKDIQAAFEAGEIKAARAAREIVFHTEDVQAGLRFAKSLFAQRPHAGLHEEIGNMHGQAGQDFIARNIYIACLTLYGKLHVSNLVHADIPVANAFVDEARRLLYIPIPKCGSSTLKNYLSFGLTGQMHRELVHFRMPDHYRFVTVEDLRTRYAGFTKFAVVRDPLSRVASYFSRNVTLGALKRLSYDIDDFRGLPTVPDAQTFVARFEDYRRFFLDARHHTDQQIRYLEPFLAADVGLEVYGMGGIATLRELISERYGKEIRDERFMVTGPEHRQQKIDPAVWEPLRQRYARDYEVFGACFDMSGDSGVPFPLKVRRKPRPIYFDGRGEYVGQSLPRVRRKVEEEAAIETARDTGSDAP